MVTTSEEKKTFVIGSRKSQLALVQTYIVRDTLQSLFPQYEFKIAYSLTRRYVFGCHHGARESKRCVGFEREKQGKDIEHLTCWLGYRYKFTS